MADDLSVDTVRFDASNLTLGRSIVHALALSSGVAGVTIGTVADFLSSPKIDETTFFVDRIPREAIGAWAAFFRAVTYERRQHSLRGGPYIVILQPIGLSDDYAARLRAVAPTRKMLGCVSSIDTNAWAAASGISAGTGFLERVAFATTLEVAAWSRDLLQLVLTWAEVDQLSPLSKLQVLARSHAWPFPCWENGLVDLWEGIAVPHAGAAIAHGFQDDIDRRIWTSQARAIFPFLDAARRGAIRKYIDVLDQMVSPKTPYQKRFNDKIVEYRSPWDLELYDICKLLEGKLTAQESKGLIAFRNSRNSLAHGKPIEIASLQKIAAWWQRFTEILPPMVPGWNWPRAGQRLLMTIGPAAGGKSSWAASQVAQVISADCISAEMTKRAVVHDQSSVFRSARAQATKILETGSDVVIDAAHLQLHERVTNAKLVPLDLSVEYVILDRELDAKVLGLTEKMVGKVERAHYQFQTGIEPCLAGDNLVNVKVKDLRAAKS
ncbi:AAA family ATPase [Phyllobacterium endophyticum]|uniref:AAA family ATPase n=1 Tax=Phyllobacterium endophyticum TaxID=1149773 RepID=UPI0011B27A85|nr:AAA family ATPase [Phyllobacterium endophyticum]MBB3237153.1 hypothetical protein [Phyllobacterium endophyticum]TYR40609.1 hypothetical protein FY050_17010 [Phyllobacterium endophyticum]